MKNDITNSDELLLQFNTARMFLAEEEEEEEEARIVVSLLDVTERKRAEEELRKSDKKYRDLVENLGKEYFFYRHDRDGVFTYVSNSMTDMLGYSKEEFLTHHTEHHTGNPINKEAVKHTELSIQGQQQAPYEVEIYHKDRSIIWLEVTEVPLRNNNGEVNAIEGIAKNITGRKHAEEELKSRMEELERFNRLSVGRELKMIELKKRIQELEGEKNDKK